MHTTRLPRLCAVIPVTSLPEAIAHLHAAQPLADWIELRLDYLPEPRIADLVALSAHMQRPCIVCCRAASEGGRFSGSRTKQRELLQAAIALGYGYVDIDWLALPELAPDIDPRHWILSYHHFSFTPPLISLHRQLIAMQNEQPYALKLATTVQSFQAASHLLCLVRMHASNTRMIVVGMGNNGKIVRVMAPLLGGYLTYAALPDQQTAAGQPMLTELREAHRIVVGSRLNVPCVA